MNGSFTLALISFTTASMHRGEHSGVLVHVIRCAEAEIGYAQTRHGGACAGLRGFGL